MGIRTISRMQSIAENLWVMRYPLRLAGTESGRTVTIVRLPLGKLVIHSTAPFTASDVAAISKLGEPGWLIDVTHMHDTFAREGRDAFPSIPYLAPDGFDAVVKFPTEPLIPTPSAWRGVFDVMRFEGVKMNECACFHRPSRTLILADLVFNFGSDNTGWERFMRRSLAGMKEYPAMSRFFKLMINNRAAFKQSMQSMLGEWDFDRVIVGHGEIIETGGKEKLKKALTAAGVI